MTLIKMSPMRKKRQKSPVQKRTSTEVSENLRTRPSAFIKLSSILIFEEIRFMNSPFLSPAFNLNEPAREKLEPELLPGWFI